ncbi:MAG: hypothetical protein OEP45_02940 [Acidobacteriota bacterium]|nr:hypothetical protein [Acidobacteriota bacterium]
MRHKAILFVGLLGLLATVAPAQDTPPSIVDAYEALADTILSLRAAEHGFVRAMLDGHRHAAQVRYAQGNWEAAAAEIALFANEGDNAIGGVRKRLLEGGHHFNAAGEEQGIFEPGYVVVTSAAKTKLLAASAALRQAADETARAAAWADFEAVAAELLAAE